MIIIILHNNNNHANRCVLVPDGSVVVCDGEVECGSWMLMVSPSNQSLLK